MSTLLQAIRGMNDLLPEDNARLQWLTQKISHILNAYQYREIKTPIVEKTALFARSVGEGTDIVEKEMYTFIDRNEESLTLRPEGTASVVRAALEHGLVYNQIQRFWYMGPMFRHERPQKGRYRQFYQLGAEVFGLQGPDIDAEMLVMLKRMFAALNLLPHLTLEINCLGTEEERKHYRTLLVAYFKSHENELDEDSKARLISNPLRILDSKNPALAPLIQGAPKLLDHLNEASKQHFARLQSLLKALKVDFVINPRLVRGLDYYALTVFEWTTDLLGAQATVCAGGRYDGLVQLLGGQATPAIGFAMGLERLLLLLEAVNAFPILQQSIDLYFILNGEADLETGMVLAEQVRNTLPAVTIQTHMGGGSIKNQLKRADKSGARYALIISEDESAPQQFTLKDLRANTAPLKADLNGLIEILAGQS